MARRRALTPRAPTAPELRPLVRRVVRIGYAAKRTIYLLIGTLALRLALRDGGALTDSSGALSTTVEQPFGLALLTIVAVGILAYAGWEITQAVVDPRRKGSNPQALTSRALAIVKGAVYGLVGVEALRMVLGLRGQSQDADDYARTAMTFPLGGVLLALVGLGILVYGLQQLLMAWRSECDDDLNEPSYVKRVARGS
jgi:uncharacterized membrane protein YidH (DUF202 family)